MTARLKYTMTSDLLVNPHLVDQSDGLEGLHVPLKTGERERKNLEESTADYYY